MFKTNIFSRILIFLYLAIPYFPLFGEIDRIASQWFFLSALNIICLPFVYFKAPNKDFFKIFRFKPFLGFCAFIIFCLISFIDSINLIESSVEFFRHASVLIAIINFSLLLNFSSKNRHYLFVAVIFFCCIEVLGLILQYGQGLELIGFTGNKNIASASMIIKSNFLLYLIIRYNNTFIKVFVAFLLALIYFVVFMIGSKAGTVSLVLTGLILVISIVYDRKLFKFSWVPLISLIFSSLISLQINDNVYEAVNNTINYVNDSGSTDRIRYYAQAFDSFLNHPFNGVGIGNWKIYSVLYDAKFMTDYIVQYHTHNDYLQFFAEIGFGAISYLFFIVSLIYMTLKTFVFKSLLTDENKSISFIALLAISIYFLDSNLNFPASRVIMQLNLILIFSIIYNLFAKKQEHEIN